jgi:hypothetical protein
MMRALLSTLLLGLLACSIVSAASIELGGDTAMRGEPTSLRIVAEADSASGWAVSVTYFPNSVIEQVVEVGVTDVSASVAWTPEFAGLATIKATRGDESASLSTSVRFPSIPSGAIAVFLLAGVILLGGAAWSLAQMFRNSRAAA